MPPARRMMLVLHSGLNITSPSAHLVPSISGKLVHTALGPMLCRIGIAQ